ncbi:UNVERIFIED_ORG: phosphonate transport system permease protein [Xanthobacter viscosus]|jgi:phosphonate transport system permease protein|uniref:Phosphonate ABC transporter, permease protein PhnE n=1 Tax=Xanthobacter autotrophicus TaxID=280 RepID=A0A6C1KK89_XANAU|nr:phosphonate ABC transporter, permease protein PhnE [Xanthobacter autotrophicus]TLX44738.1 phosphonate ABC transporter, permease protein PhnE [Xanthobacter autotrophicus]
MSRARITLDAEARARLAAAYPEALAPSPAQRLRMIAIVAALAGMAMFGFWRLDFNLDRIGSGLVQLGHFLTLMIPPDPGTQLPLYIHALGETLAIAFLGTLLGALVAFPFGFLAAKNVIPNIFAHFAVRRLLDTVRGVDRLIWALIFVTVVGLGPFAGILAIATASFAELGKLFSEAVEALDRKPVEGIVSTGGSEVEAVRFGMLPQVLPVLASQLLYYFESNARQSTIVGIVGAGGLGLHLAEQIRVLEWQKVSFLILMMLVMVAVIDFISSRLRFSIIGKTRLEP